MSGYFIFDPVKKGRIKHKKIYMTDYFDFTEEMYRNVLVHEMIHYYIAYNKIEDNEDHGVEFMKLAESLNRKYGLSITKKISSSSTNPLRIYSFRIFVAQMRNLVARADDTR